MYNYSRLACMCVCVLIDVTAFISIPMPTIMYIHIVLSLVQIFNIFNI